MTVAMSYAPRSSVATMASIARGRDAAGVAGPARAPRSRVRFDARRAPCLENNRSRAAVERTQSEPCGVRRGDIEHASDAASHHDRARRRREHADAAVDAVDVHREPAAAPPGVAAAAEERRARQRNGRLQSVTVKTASTASAEHRGRRRVDCDRERVRANEERAVGRPVERPPLRAVLYKRKSGWS